MNGSDLFGEAPPPKEKQKKTSCVAFGFLVTQIKQGVASKTTIFQFPQQPQVPEALLLRGFSSSRRPMFFFNSNLPLLIFLTNL